MEKKVVLIYLVCYLGIYVGQWSDPDSKKV
jgi:uncharacterized membrane protein